MLDTKLQTQRWYVIKGWADPIPLVEMPAESPVSSRIVAGPSLDCETAWAPLIRAGVTDADGWVYAHNCTAFAEIGKDGELKVQHAESALRASAHSEKQMLDYCRQRTWLRRRPFADASSANAVAIESTQCGFELVGVRRGDAATPVDDGGSADKEAGHFHVDAESSDEDEHADEHASAATSSAAPKRQNATVVDQPQLVHLRNKSNTVLYAALYARAAMPDVAGAMGYRRVDSAVHELGFNRCLAVQPCGASAVVSTDSIVVIVSTATPDQWSNFYASGQLSDSTGESVYIPVAVGDFKKVFLIAEVVSGRTTNPAQMLGNMSAADDVSSSANTVILVSALSSWQWAIQKRTGHWTRREDAMRRDTERRKRVHADGPTAKMASVCDQTATAAPQPGLSAEEDAYAAQRWVRCQAALRRFMAGGGGHGGGGAAAVHSDGLGAIDSNPTAHPRADQIDARDLPRIGFCYSGGGVRALINGLGATLGADAIGLHDAVLYSSGLSGGSWFLALFTQRPMPGAAECESGAADATSSTSAMDAFLSSLRTAFRYVSNGSNNSNDNSEHFDHYQRCLYHVAASTPIFTPIILCI